MTISSLRSRGLAADFIASLPDMSALDAHFDTRRHRVIQVLRAISTARTLTPSLQLRLASAMRPVFSMPRTLLFTDRRRIFVTDQMARMSNMELLDSGHAPVFTETGIGLMRFWMTVDGRTSPGRLCLDREVPAFIGRHAIERLMQRGVASEADLARSVRRALIQAAEVMTVAGATDSLPDKTTSFLLPWANGALACVVTPVRKAQAETDKGVPTAAIRTWLSADFLDEEARLRVAMLENAPWAAFGAKGKDFEGWTRERWQARFRANARPFTLTTRSAPVTDHAMA